MSVGFFQCQTEISHYIQKKKEFFRNDFLCVWYFFCIDEIGIHGAPLVVDGAELWFVPDKNLSFQEAISYCQRNDSDLASVESYPKLRTILSQIEKVRKFI